MINRIFTEDIAITPRENGMIPNMVFNVDWWNAPYKAESEDKE